MTATDPGFFLEVGFGVFTGGFGENGLLNVVY